MRLAPLWSHLHALSARLRGARALWVGTDFDGTLAPIAARPGHVRLDPRTAAALARLAALRGTRVAVLSGRALEDLGRLVRVRGVFLAGENGLATRAPGGGRVIHVPRPKRLSSALRRELSAWCEGFPGAWVEKKRVTLAVHDRALAAPRRAAFGAGVRRIAARGGARVVPGKLVFEVMPDVPADKATAFEHWCPPSRRGALFFLGDDTNDEPVHERVRARGGVTVAVGRRRSRAEYALRDPDDVVRFLEWLAAAWSGRSRGGRAG